MRSIYQVPILISIVLNFSCQKTPDLLIGSWKTEYLEFHENENDTTYRIPLDDLEPTHITFFEDRIVKTNYPFFLISTDKYLASEDSINIFPLGSDDYKFDLAYKIQSDSLKLYIPNSNGYRIFHMTRTTIDNDQIRLLEKETVDWNQFQKKWTPIESKYGTCQKCQLKDIDLSKKENYDKNGGQLFYNKEDSLNLIYHPNSTIDSLVLFLYCPHENGTGQQVTYISKQ
ncbi:MAG: hypothetical protein HUJ25_13040 [Crocinitomicaceae bacterium]|nr:hypothetical protein [Crocinitomicaceae bacterium]